MSADKGGRRGHYSDLYSQCGQLVFPLDHCATAKFETMAMRIARSREGPHPKGEDNAPGLEFAGLYPLALRPTNIEDASHSRG